MMKQEAIFKKIGLILEELNDQYEFLEQNPHQFSELELDLFLANSNFLANHIQILKKIVVNQPISNAAPTNQEKENQIVEPTIDKVANDDVSNFSETNHVSELIEIEQTKEEIVPAIEEIEEEIFKLDNTSSAFEFILNDHAEHEKFEFEEKSVDELFNRPLSGEEERIIAEKKKLNTNQLIEEEEDEEVGPEPFLVVKEQEVFPIVEEDLLLELEPAPPKIVQSDKLVEDPSNKPTLNELLASKSNLNNINTDKPAISDLKQAINLNDKLLYIKDLFNGYNLAYAEAIEIANKLANFDAADNFFQKNYAVKNNWSEKEATVNQFYELLNQRFR